ncbi:MAG: hypothetical protein UHK60_08185 [Acutalibacteraceae bacterium]|nr:hypothetical protein [Acutalibacteraceae bacterium]
MIIDFNGVVREMTAEEIERLEYLISLFPEKNEIYSAISERIQKLENENTKTVLELSTLKETMNNVKNLLLSFDKSTTNPKVSVDDY